jgi:hypothetical protein
VALGVWTPHGRFVVAKPVVIDGPLRGVYPQHEPAPKLGQATPAQLDRLVVSVGDRAVRLGHGQSGLIANPCTGTLNSLGAVGQKESRT